MSSRSPSEQTPRMAGAEVGRTMEPHRPVAQLLLESRPLCVLLAHSICAFRSIPPQRQVRRCDLAAGFPGGCRHRALLVCSVASPGAKTYRKEKEELGERA